MRDNTKRDAIRRIRALKNAIVFLKAVEANPNIDSISLAELVDLKSPCAIGAIVRRLRHDFAHNFSDILRTKRDWMWGRCWRGGPYIAQAIVRLEAKLAEEETALGLLKLAAKPSASLACAFGYE